MNRVIRSDIMITRNRLKINAALLNVLFTEKSLKNSQFAKEKY